MARGGEGDEEGWRVSGGRRGEGEGSFSYLCLFHRVTLTATSGGTRQTLSWSEVPHHTPVAQMVGEGC